VLFEFSDGWFEARFHMTKESRTPDTANEQRAASVYNEELKTLFAGLPFGV
jgi:hypothetical protein